MLLECYTHKEKALRDSSPFCSIKVLRIPKKLRGFLLRGFSIEDKPPLY
jgi:hypothetical protein